MKWVKIEDGCEMPEHCEIVVVTGTNDESWWPASHILGAFHPVDEDMYACMYDELRGVTHWARVELPEE